MDKQAFLDELKGHLKVLQDEEQEDILDEYLQHIEMKIKDGLEEEEAIRDFGPIQELAAEILKAYHVKPGFDQEPKKGREGSRKGLYRSRPSDPGEEGDGGQRLAGMIEISGECVKKAAYGAVRAGKRVWMLIGCCAGWAYRLVSAPFRKAGAYIEMKREQRDGAARYAGPVPSKGAGCAGMVQSEGAGCAGMVQSEGGGYPKMMQKGGCRYAGMMQKGGDGYAGMVQDERSGYDGLVRSGEIGYDGLEQNEGAGYAEAGYGLGGRRQDLQGLGQLHAGGLAGGLLRRIGSRLFRAAGRLVRGIVALSLLCCRLAWNCGVFLVTAFSAFFGLLFLFLLGMLTVLLYQGYPFTGIAIGCLGAVICCASFSVFCCTFFAEGAGRRDGTEGNAGVDVGRAGRERGDGAARGWKMVRQRRQSRVRQKGQAAMQEEGQSMAREQAFMQREGQSMAREQAAMQKEGQDTVKVQGSMRKKEEEAVRDRTERAVKEAGISSGADRKERAEDHGQEK